LNIIDNFLSPSYADEIENILTSTHQEWYFNKNITDEDKNGNLLSYGFSYWVIRPVNNSPTQSSTSVFLQPFLLLVKDAIQANSVIRCRLDMTVCSGEPVLHYPHVDCLGQPNITAIYYVNDADGDTVVYNEKQPSDEYTVLRTVTPKKNRLFFFDGDHYHTGHSPMTCQNRVLINSNFI